MIKIPYRRTGLYFIRAFISLSFFPFLHCFSMFTHKFCFFPASFNIGVFLRLLNLFSSFPNQWCQLHTWLDYSPLRCWQFYLFFSTPGQENIQFLFCVLFLLLIHQEGKKRHLIHLIVTVSPLTHLGLSTKSFCIQNSFLYFRGWKTDIKRY